MPKSVPGLTLQGLRPGGALLVVITVLLVALPSAEASASGPTHKSVVVFAAPYLGLQAVSSGTGRAYYGCTINSHARELAPLVFNGTNGGLHGKWRASAAPPTACASSYSDARANEYEWITFTSPNLSVAHGGIYALRYVWWLHWTLSYSMVDPGNGTGNCWVADQVYGSMWVDDLTTQTRTVPVTSVFTNWSAASGVGNGTLSVNTWMSLGVIALLPHGQVFRVGFELFQSAQAHAGISTSSQATLTFDSGGRHPMSLLRITAR